MLDLLKLYLFGLPVFNEVCFSGMDKARECGGSVFREVLCIAIVGGDLCLLLLLELRLENSQWF